MFANLDFFLYLCTLFCTHAFVAHGRIYGAYTVHFRTIVGPLSHPGAHYIYFVYIP